MAYERTLSNVENDRGWLSYNKNSISGVVFSVLCGFFNLQENNRRRRRTMAPRSKPFLYLTFVSPQQTFRVVFGPKKLNMLVQSPSSYRRRYSRRKTLRCYPSFTICGISLQLPFFSFCKRNQSWQAACWPRAPSRRACRGSPPTSVMKSSPLPFYDRQSAAKKHTYC